MPTLAKQRCSEELANITRQLHAAQKEAQLAKEQCQEMEKSLATRSYWKILKTEFGVVLQGEEGETMLPPGVWEEMVIKLSTIGEGNHDFQTLKGFTC